MFTEMTTKLILLLVGMTLVRVIEELMLRMNCENQLKKLLLMK
jgi:hypothetical protein